jgi:hypothetical protein
MAGRDEGTLGGPSPIAHVPLDGAIAAGVPVLGDEPSVDLDRRGPLFPRSGLVGHQDGIYQRADRIEDGGWPWGREGVWEWRWGAKCLQDGRRRVPEITSDLPKGESFAAQLADPRVPFHIEHLSSPMSDKWVNRGRTDHAFPELTLLPGIRSTPEQQPARQEPVAEPA